MSSQPTLMYPQGCVVITGNFDGVHRGHHRLIEELKKVAKAKGLPPVVVSFEPHTRKVVKGIEIPRLTTPNEKKERFEKVFGLDLVLLEFNAEMQKLSAEEYASQILANTLGAKVWVRGRNHSYGHGGVHGECFAFIECVDVDLNCAGDMVISSTQIRKSLKQGDLAEANKLLGYEYSLEGKVGEGDRRGRTLGFPTANIQIEYAEKLIPPDGVYGGYVELDGRRFSAVANLGARPSFDQNSLPRVEVYLLDFEGDLYGQSLKFSLQEKIRNSQPFDSLETLKKQIADDVSYWRKNQRDFAICDTDSIEN